MFLKHFLIEKGIVLSATSNPFLTLKTASKDCVVIIVPGGDEANTLHA